MENTKQEEEQETILELNEALQVHLATAQK